ncbi:neutral zinc metallopeptidase [Streptosporangiaceae bacterium NEAU-GS5]|nr:neutral zinc metallopeptidase [Streptosporangiaceae bacterium NEAU-GS5]
MVESGHQLGGPLGRLCTVTRWWYPTPPSKKGRVKEMRRLVAYLKATTYLLTVLSSFLLAMSATPSQAAGHKAPLTHQAAQQAKNLDTDIRDAVKITDGFWKAHWSDYFTGHYVKPKVFGSYSKHGKNPPKCGGEKLEYNNAYYCEDGKYVAWDRDFLADGYKKGDAWVYLIIAHEWGHAIADQLDEKLKAKANELQADCLAGATLYGAADDGTLEFDNGDVAEIKASFKAIGDDKPWTKPGDHGTAAQRLAAFDKGHDGGVAACVPDAADDDNGDDDDSGDDDDDNGDDDSDDDSDDDDSGDDDDDSDDDDSGDDDDSDDDDSDDDSGDDDDSDDEE